MNERVERYTMSVPEAAAELGVCTNIVYDLIHTDDFPVIWFGRKARINREGLRLWINRHTQGMEVTQ